MTAAAVHVTVAGSAVEHADAVRAGVRDVDGVRVLVDGDAAWARANGRGRSVPLAATMDVRVASGAVRDGDGVRGRVRDVDGVRPLVDGDAACAGPGCEAGHPSAAPARDVG